MISAQCYHPKTEFARYIVCKPKRIINPFRGNGFVNEKKGALQDAIDSLTKVFNQHERFYKAAESISSTAYSDCYL